MSQLSILLVDDEQFALSLSQKVLSKIGCSRVTTANNGRQALEILAASKSPIDVVICDLNMPEMDGVEFIRNAAEASFTGGVVFLSGEDERLLETAHDLADAYQLNIVGALPKPLRPEVIYLLLQSYEPRQKRTSPPPQEISEEELRVGLKEGCLQLVYQPQVLVATGEITGVESLARWDHAERGILGPAAFIGVADRAGLMDELTSLVCHAAIAQTGKWMTEGRRIRTSLNFSVNSFNRAGIVESLLESVKAEGVDPSMLVLEVTETQVMHDALNCLEVLMKLRMKKFALSIDDFGTGHSSMEQLRRIPFTELKVDRAFVCGATENRSARAILESSITLGKKLKMTIVAEGVETRADWDLVTSLGCDIVQGYYCAKPMTAAAFADFITDWDGPH